MRYLSNTAPGRNLGGWFDTFDCAYNLNSYVEQGYLTLFAKAPEVTLFCMGLMLFRERIYTPLAGFAFTRVDAFLDKLAEPRGISCYLPFHSSGENYLHGYLGMLGLPLEPTPYRPQKTSPVLLTQNAAADPEIVEFIKETLQAGNTVVVTSGLVRTLADRGFKDIVEIDVLSTRCTVREFGCQTFLCAFETFAPAQEPILMPEVVFNTNDVKQVVVGFSEHRNIPVLLECRYHSGRLFVLSIPDDPGDLSHFPREALDLIRKRLLQDFPVRLNAPSGIGMFLYANDSFIVESFLSTNRMIDIVIDRPGAVLTDLETGDTVSGRDEQGETIIRLQMLPSSFRVFSIG